MPVRRPKPRQGKNDGTARTMDMVQLSCYCRKGKIPSEPDHGVGTGPVQREARQGGTRVPAVREVGHRKTDDLDRGARPSAPGGDDFVDKLADHLRKYKDIPEIPRSQRYATRPGLAVLLPDGIVHDHRKLRRRLSEAVEKHGYRQSEIARQVGVHYSTISRWLREDENARRKT